MTNSSSRVAIWLLALSVVSWGGAQASEDPHSLVLRVGAAAVDITPSGFEKRPVDETNPFWSSGKPFYDSGVDGYFDAEETGYSPLNPDPARDNYDRKLNPQGTEGDGVYQFMHLGGFRPLYPLMLPNRFAAGQHDPIWARALVILGTNGVPVIFVSTDLPGLTWKHINPVRRELERALRVPRQNIIIASTHNHAGPDAAGYWTTLLKDNNRWYTDWLKTKLVEAVEQAWRSMEPARMRVVTTSHIACVDPHSLELKKDPDCRIAPNKSAYFDKKGPIAFEKIAPGLDVPIIQTDIRDPIVRNTRIVAAQFSKWPVGPTIATWINWHNHPDTMEGENQMITSDYSHYLREYVERQLGGIAVYFTGTLGSQIGSAPDSPVPLWDEERKRVYDEGRYDVRGRQVPKFVTRGWEKIRSIGYEVGSEVVSALEGEHSWEYPVVVRVRTEPLDIKVDNFLHKVATKRVWMEGVEEEDSMRKYGERCTGWGCVQSDVSVVEIGSLGVATLPGEIDPVYFLGRPESVISYGFPYGKHRYPALQGFDPFMPGRHHMVLGQANNYLSYLVHAADNLGWWNLSHPNYYEEGVTVSKNFGDDAGNKMMQMLGSPYRYSEREILPLPPYYPAVGAPARAMVRATRLREPSGDVSNDVVGSSFGARVLQQLFGVIERGGRR